MASLRHRKLRWGPWKSLLPKTNGMKSWRKRVGIEPTVPIKSGPQDLKSWANTSPHALPHFSFNHLQRIPETPPDLGVRCGVRCATLRHFSARLNPLPETTARSRLRTNFVLIEGPATLPRPRVRRPRALHVQTNRYSLKVVQPLHRLPAGGWCSPYTTFPPPRTSKLPHSRCQR